MMEALLTSQEVQSAKNARKVAKGALSRVVNQLKKYLVLEPGVKYDFHTLDKYSIKVDVEKLATSLKTLQEANEKYGVAGTDSLRLKKASEDMFTQFEESVDEYWAEARKEASNLLNLYNYEYSTALDRYLKNIEEESKLSVPPLTPSKSEVQKAKKKAEIDLHRQLNRWELVKAEWNCHLEQLETDTAGFRTLSDEELLVQPILLDADLKINNLKEAWESTKKFQELLWVTFDESDLVQDEVDKKINFNAISETKRMHQTLKDLERLSVVIKKQEVMKKNEVEAKKDTVLVTDRSGEKPALKMDRIQTPKYTGKAEDFASWKERFCALVPHGRDQAEVSVLLEQAIPEGKRYLLRGCGQDYNKMLDVLQKELAPTRDVVNAVNLQLSKLKRITPDEKESDRKFVQMVEIIEKIVRDLQGIDRLSAIAYCNTIQDMERKLPHLVKTDWYKLKRNENLEDSTSFLKFWGL